jgi:hypothetical protein
MTTDPDTHKYPSTCLRLLAKLLPLQQIIQVQQQQNVAEGGDQVSVNSSAIVLF